MDALKELAPHVENYWDMMTGDIRWLPYVIFFNGTDYQSPAVNTDSGGFRFSYGPLGEGPYSLQDNPGDDVNLLFGASPAFGYGASSDRMSLASQLGKGSAEGPWLNMAAPAFNSTQETMLFLLHRNRFPRVQNIVLFSGLNTLVVAGLPQEGHPYGQFFFSGEFFGQLGVPENLLAQPRWAAGRIVQAAKRLGRSGGSAEDDRPRVPDQAERLETALRTVARDLDRFLELAAPTGARVHYVLQPTAAWTGKPFSPEEQVLFEKAVDDPTQAWELFRPVLDSSVHAEYAKRFEGLCKERGVPFLDMNTEMRASPLADQWLFVDQLHLNDEGYRLAAEIMRTRLDLA